jgi:hypothetical protein
MLGKVTTAIGEAGGDIGAINLEDISAPHTGPRWPAARRRRTRK